MHACTLMNLKKGISLSMAWMEVHIQQKLFSDLLHFCVNGNGFLFLRRH